VSFLESSAVKCCIEAPQLSSRRVPKQFAFVRIGGGSRCPPPEPSKCLIGEVRKRWIGWNASLVAVRQSARLEDR
jgi:hypothetical protein